MKSNTLISLISELKHSEHVGVTFIDKSDLEVFLSYSDLYKQAIQGLAYLQDQGLNQGDELVLQIECNRTFIIVFWSCILGGIIPVPLTIGKNHGHKQKLFAIWSTLNKPYLITSQKNIDQFDEFALTNNLESRWEKIREKFLNVDNANSSHDGEVANVKPDDIAFIQFSSGSTGAPKGVVLSHRNLLTNIEAISSAAMYSDKDSLLSWMPLTHDMGLIGFHLNPLFCGINHYIMRTDLFVRRPTLWMEKASEHKATILCSPNFGYRYLLKYLDVEHEHKWNLSTVRLIYNGAEPISEKLGRDFITQLSIYKLGDRVICPVYGLAEASLAVTISNLSDDVISLELDREHLGIGDKIQQVKGHQNAVSIVNVGRVIDYCKVRITSSNDQTVDENVIGHIQISGSNVTRGYYCNDLATKEALTADAWMRTGDLGFIINGCLYVTGRVKDMVLVNGQNFYAHDIEKLAEDVPGIELNQIIVTGFFNNNRQKEESIAFVFHRGELRNFIPIATALKSHINKKVGFELDVILPTKEIPRTTSGKLQRFKMLDMYKEGHFNNLEADIEIMMQSLGSLKTAADVPHTISEQKLLKIWQYVLNNKAIGITDDFFEYGGNSLKAAELSMAISKELKIELPLEILYEKHTVRELNQEIQKGSWNEYTSIISVQECDFYPLSSAQRRIYYAWHASEKSTAYNLPVTLDIKGKLDAKHLEKCLYLLVLRHEVLRMSFHNPIDPVFKIHEKSEFKLSRSQGTTHGLNKYLKDLVQPFDLAAAPLFRVELIELNQQEYVLFLDFHHIISDGVSVSKFIDELCALYRGEELPLIATTYKDYIFWEQEKLLSTDRQNSLKEYWTSQFGNTVSPLNFPIDFKRPIIFNTEGEKIEFEIDKDIVVKLRNLAVANGCTLHVLLCTVYSVLLSKYTCQEEIVFGIPVTDRDHPDLQQIHGLFVNNLAIKNTVLADKSFIDILIQHDANIKCALKNKDYPFENLVRDISEKRDASRNPVFDTMFVYQNMQMPNMVCKNVEMSMRFFDPGFSKFDISLEVFEQEHSIKYAIEYAQKLFTKSTIFNFQRHFEQLLLLVTNEPTRKICDLSLLSEKEYEGFVNEFNDTLIEYPSDKTIHQLFEEQVERTPEAIAIEFEDTLLTYSQLQKEANEMASLLRSKNISKESVVAIVLDRSPQLIVSLLGILKAGGAFLLIDKNLPEKRIKYIIEHSKCSTIITDSNYHHIVHNLISDSTVAVIEIDKLNIPASEKNIDHQNNSNDLAYLIYTSGTTGEPKGVMVEHKSLVNYVTWAAKTYVNNESGNFPLFTSISFDLTITSIFTPLITGNKIVVYQDDDRNILLEKVIRDNKVQVIKLTPSHLRILIESNILDDLPKKSIKKIIVGGEAFETSLALAAHEKFSKDIEIYNEYGPTEATVGCMIHKFDPSCNTTNVPIGSPIANNRIYVLDKQLKPVPSGIEGELWLAGDGLARGYLYNEEMTEQKFATNPFVTGTKMYKTGDIAKRLPDGSITFVGRFDQQVKINGYRIELLEIEMQLLKYSGVESAIVMARSDEHNRKYLCAYYMVDGISSIQVSQLRQFLSSILPFYMIPVHYVLLSEIPLTRNGKVDYNSLPEPYNDKEKVGLKDLTDLEEVFLKVWENVFDQNGLNINDNFFDLGGDSIKSVQIVARLSDEGIYLNTKDIITYQTIEQISKFAKPKKANNQYSQGLLQGVKRLTPIETWFFSKPLVNQNYYNQSLVLKLNRRVNVQLFEKAFELLIRHHDGLRLNYDHDKQTMFYNSNHLSEPFRIEVYQSLAKGQSMEDICQKIKSSFDISNSLLLKAAIIHENEKSEVLFITAHHLIIDGVSWRILLEDLHKVYSCLEKDQPVSLSPKTGSLLDWDTTLNTYLDSEEFIKQKEYWENIINTKLTLPQDFETLDWSVGKVVKISRNLDKEQTTFLVKDSHKMLQTDVPILLNVALILALKEWTGHSEFIIEQETHGRHLALDISKTTGWFTNIFPFKVSLLDDALDNQIEAVKEQFRDVPDNGIGYGILMKNMNAFNNMKMAEIRMNYLGQFDGETNNELFTFLDKHTGSDIDLTNQITAKLEINCMVINEKFEWSLNYNSLAYKTETMNNFCDSIFKHLQTILQFLNEQKEIRFSPSDFEASLSSEDLKEIFG